MTMLLDRSPFASSFGQVWSRDACSCGLVNVHRSEAAMLRKKAREKPRLRWHLLFS